MSSRFTQAALALAKAAVRRKVKYVILHVTANCSAQCRFCFNADGMKRRENARTLSLDGIRELAKKLHILPQLTLSGGEPTLRPDVADIVEAFYADAQTRFFTLPTNALQPGRIEDFLERFVRDCPSAFLNIVLPFHGDAEAFESAMGVPDAYENFLRTAEIVQRARVRHRNVAGILTCAIDGFNHEQGTAIVELAQRRFGGWPFGVLYARPPTRDPQAARAPVGSYLAACSRSGNGRTRKSRYNPFTIIQESLHGRITQMVVAAECGEISDLRCNAGRNFLVIFDDGAVYPCEPTEALDVTQDEGAPSTFCLGKIADFDYDLDALLRSEPARGVVEWIDSHPCVCTWECAIYSRLVHSPSELVRLGVNAAKYVLK